MHNHTLHMGMYIIGFGLSCYEYNNVQICGKHNATNYPQNHRFNEWDLNHPQMVDLFLGCPHQYTCTLCIQILSETVLHNKTPEIIPQSYFLRRYGWSHRARKIDRQKDRQIDRERERQTNRQINKQTDRQTDRQIDGWMDGWTDGWMDGWTGGWMDGWMGGWMGR